MSALSCASSASRKLSATSMSDYCSTLHTAVSSSRSSLALSDEYYETSSERLSPRASSSDPVLTRQSVRDDNSVSNGFGSRSDSSEHIGYCALADEDDGGSSLVESARSDSCLSQPSVSSDFGTQLLASLRLMGLFGSSDHIFVTQDSYRLESRALPSAPTTTPRLPDSPSSVNSFVSAAPSESGVDDEDEDEDLVTPRPAVQVPTQSPREPVDQTLTTHNLNLNNRRNPSPSPSPPPQDEPEAQPSSVSEAKRLILENLAQLSRGELFSRPAQTQPSALPSTTLPDSGIANRPTISPIGSPVVPKVANTSRPRMIGRVGSLGSSSSRKRLESLLRIDLELQPLNIRLSRLLAEFRAEFYGQLARRESYCPRLLAACASSSSRKLAARACRSCGDYNPIRFPIPGGRTPKRRFCDGSAPGSRPSVSLKELIGVNSSSLAEQLSRSAMINYSNEGYREHGEHNQQQQQRGIGAANYYGKRIESARPGSMMMMSGRSWRTLVPRSELVN